MRVHETMFDDFFAHRLPDDGFTIEEVYTDYFGFLEKQQEHRSELHGYVVTMDGRIVVPRLRPTAEDAEV